MALGLGTLAAKKKCSVVESAPYDYILVGGGTAGCVLANRLTEDGTKKVLVVEAGSKSPSHPHVKIPVAILKLFKSAWDWNFASEPAPQLAERELYLCRGKTLGGSSCTNVMLYTRGAEGDYDAWAAECDDESWKGANMIEYFKKSEQCLSKENAGVGQWHGGDGPAAVSDVPYKNPLSSAFLEAAGQAGYENNNDFNDWSKPQQGFGPFQVSQRNGKRESAASAYLSADVRRRPNLDVVTGATATKIKFQGSKAVGIDLAFEGGLKEATALLNDNAEIILTAGAIGSPQVLMLSGVGPANELAEHGIPIVADRPGVGKNLQDHPACLVSRFSKPGAPKSHSTSLRIPGTTATNPIAALKWATAGTGPLTSPGCDHGGFAYAKDSDESMPDIQYRFLATKTITPDGMSTIASSYKAVKNHPNGFTIQTLLARPKSTDGQVTLNSADPFTPPKISIPYFKDERDVNTMVQALRQAREIMDQPALAQYAGEEEYPGPGVTTDAQLADYARQTAHTANALVGTCKLGKLADPLAVVDNTLRVIGTSNLRVCDSSVMPTLPGGQTASSTIAIAEKAADLLLQGVRTTLQGAPQANMALPA